VEATGRKRPTWLGVELVNKVVAGNLMMTTHDAAQPSWRQAPINGIGSETTVDEIQSFAFGDGERRGLVLFNLSLHQTRRMTLSLPHSPAGEAMLYSIAPSSIHDNNEDSTTVVIDSMRITDFDDGYELDLPPHSIHALNWPNGTTTVESAPIPVLSLDVLYGVQGSISLRAQLPEGAGGILEIRDVLGRRVVQLASDLRGAGPHFRQWTSATSGSYIAVLRTADAQLVRWINIAR